MKKSMATFAAGCFWGVEAAFRHIDGVVTTFVGYTGGHAENPTYEQVCADNTGHAEAVQIEYDADKISYDALLNTFWRCHNPTTLNRQGPDVGSQYRSVIFYHTQAQADAAKVSKKALQESGQWVKDIVTEIVPATTFYQAEDYHQRYLEKRGLSHCALKPPPRSGGENL